ncbi:DJ-1/PfpI family protein [Aquabacterium sp. A7-Y]|uniref:DJ-1/PfpI family protein n=1 Tax=Aquabacterium sp. A7-Y TaxID=1349605 RepID=UPI00223DE797|nr:DJ-1/PfpI family protein [Aquabacterium sp. A7-Y]MCW7540977.1 DJ-1/PfpI family protein [Aquabacterium sp. A7-Y]
MDSLNTISPARRRVLSALAVLGGGGLSCTAAREAQDTSPQPVSPSTPTSATAVQVQMLVHPDMTALDLIGPQLIFSTMGNTQTHLVWKDLSPITTDSGVRILPTLTLAEAPESPDILFVPGGLKGTTAMLQDADVLGYLRTRGASARWVTGVCTGALLLGAAGLLKGYRATAHWYVRDLLTVFDATPVTQRVVVDRNRITGGGVTSGIDMALTVSALLKGEQQARIQELVFEYAPEPPYASGTPQLAGDALTQLVLKRREPAIEMARQAALKARARWPT